MRVWDIPVECLCRNHLLAEHRELHAIWSVIVNEKQGYSRHPEVMRWRGKLGALWCRHEDEVMEMTKRGYAHRSPLDLDSIPRGQRGKRQSTLIDSLQKQRARLRCKECACNTSKARKTRP